MPLVLLSQYYSGHETNKSGTGKARKGMLGVLVATTEGNRALGKLKHRRQNNTGTDLKK